MIVTGDRLGAQIAHHTSAVARHFVATVGFDEFFIAFVARSDNKTTQKKHKKMST